MNSISEIKIDTSSLQNSPVNSVNLKIDGNKNSSEKLRELKKLNSFKDIFAEELKVQGVEFEFKNKNSENSNYVSELLNFTGKGYVITIPKNHLEKIYNSSKPQNNLFHPYNSFQIEKGNLVNLSL